MSDPKTIVEAAREYARMEHAGQLYGNGAPYETHLQAVVDVLARFGVTDEATIATAWLHDVIEDTRMTHQRLALAFPLAIADTVWALSGVGANRSERNAAAYEKIVGNPKARLVKLADRIANVEAGGERVQMYRKEHYRFQRALKVANPPDVEHAMWQHLDGIIAEPST